jgi:nicotinate-nucleotide adenylyltransferase
MVQKIGLFGGSFNPIHNGHLIVARSVAETLQLDRVVILPSRTPPHKSEDRSLAAGDHRAAMAKLAIEGEPGFEFSDHDLTCDGPSYTLNTIAHFRQAASLHAEIFWIIGADSLLELHTWHRVRDLAGACRIVTAARRGFDPGGLDQLSEVLDSPALDQLLADVLETPHIDISSTGIRRRALQGKSLRYLVPEPVLEYIARNGLYTD